jgi:hypothetical protein
MYNEGECQAVGEEYLFHSIFLVSRKGAKANKKLCALAPLREHDFSYKKSTCKNHFKIIYTKRPRHLMYLCIATGKRPWQLVKHTMQLV